MCEEKENRKKVEQKNRKAGHKTQQEREYKGSYTVEAAAVISMTFLVLGALIIAVFFVHDRAVIQSTVCEAAAVGSNYMTQEERSAAAQSVSGSISGQRLLGSQNLAVSVGVGEKSASAWGSAAFPVPGMFVSYFSGGSLDISCSWESSVLDPADVIRKIRGAELVIGNLSGEN